MRYERYQFLGSGAFREQIEEFDGVRYLLRTTWLERVERWTVSLLTPNRVPIVTGATLALRVPLFRGTVTGTPPGLLLAVDVDNTGVAPGYRDLNTRVVLAYVPESELG